jgi:hypothetical protein
MVINLIYYSLPRKIARAICVVKIEFNNFLPLFTIKFGRSGVVHINQGQGWSFKITIDVIYKQKSDHINRFGSSSVGFLN